MEDLINIKSLYEKFYESIIKQFDSSYLFHHISFYRYLLDYPMFGQLNSEEKFVFINLLYELMNSDKLMSHTQMCDVLISGNNDCHNLLFLYITLKKSESFQNEQDKLKYEILVDLYKKINHYRVDKCVALNFRSKKSKVYLNIISRYIIKFENLLKNNPKIYHDIFTGDTTFAILFEYFEYNQDSGTTLVKKRTDKICKFCGNNMFYDLYYYCSDNCSYIEI